MSTPLHTGAAPSDWLQRWAHLLPAGGRVLDLACGRGRHLRWAAARGFAVTGVDRDAAALAASLDLATAGKAELITADIETGPCAVLVYETFAAGNAAVGKPSRPDFLLQPGELIQRCAGLTVVAYEDGFLDTPARFVQRVVAVRPVTGAAAPPRHALLAAPAP